MHAGGGQIRKQNGAARWMHHQTSPRTHVHRPLQPLSLHGIACSQTSLCVLDPLYGRVQVPEYTLNFLGWLTPSPPVPLLRTPPSLTHSLTHNRRRSAPSWRRGGTSSTCSSAMRLAAWTTCATWSTSSTWSPFALCAPSGSRVAATAGAAAAGRRRTTKERPRPRTFVACGWCGGSLTVR